jgi:peptide/nickel transport system substrate-binding protein
MSTPQGTLHRRDDRSHSTLALLLAASLVAVVSALVSGSSFAANTAGKPIGNINFAIGGDIVKFDPAFAYDYQTTPVVSQACEGLLRFTPKGRLLPNLASSWKQVNATTFVYNIRKNVKFQDGSPLTAEDVRFSLNRYKDPKVGAYAGSYYTRVKSIAVTGPSQVTIRLTGPYSQWQYVPAMTAAAAIVSKPFVQAHPKDLGQPGVGIVCTGPFKFASWQRGQNVVLKRFDDYWNKNRMPKVAQVTFKVVEDESTLIAGLNTGAIDGTVYALDGRMAKGISGPVRIWRSPSSLVAGLLFNTQRKPWSDARVRRAFAMALDIPGIIRAAYNGYGRATKSPAPPIMFTYAKQKYERAYRALPAYKHDIAAAQALIKAAGADGASGTLMISTPTDKLVGVIVQQTAVQIGIKLTLQTVPFAKKTAIEYSPGARKYDLDLFSALGDTSDPIGFLYIQFASAAPISNVSQYKNALVDKNLNASWNAPTPAAGVTALTKAQSVIVRDAPWIPFIAADSLVPLNKRLTGWQPSTFSYWGSWAADLSGT